MAETAQILTLVLSIVSHRLVSMQIVMINLRYLFNTKNQVPNRAAINLESIIRESISITKTQAH